MKQVFLINIRPAYICNNTGNEITLNDNEKLLNSLFTSQYTFVEIYTKMAEFKGKTYKALDEQISEYSKTNSHDFLSIIIKK